MLSAPRTEEWVALCDDATTIIGRLRGGEMSAPLMLVTLTLIDRVAAWLTDARRDIDVLALNGPLTPAYEARLDYDRKKRTLAQFLFELRRLAEPVKS